MAKKSAAPSAQVNLYTQAALAENTHRSYRADLMHFKAAGGTIPCTAIQLAEYLASNAMTLAVATLQHRIIAIHRAHLDSGQPSPAMDPLVKRTMQGIRRKRGTAQRRVKALVKDDIIELVLTAEKQKPIKAARDIALILVGFAGAFRRSELVSIQREDIIEFDHGFEIHIRRTKTQQEAGHTVFIPCAKSSRCPVRALKHWLTLSGIDSGAVFRRINRHDQVASSEALTAQSIALMLKAITATAKGASAAQLVAGHSLRAGYCTEAAAAAIPTHVIMDQTGHRSSATLAKYIRPQARRRTPSIL
ncbi:tyrosine-type recombinase/integrase [Diaphorobacter sp. JS3050]|uniref:site-specific integrase n=1 Tax=Diaphorobacter sp. JS3050 TaxID=2735554 RepID=UPI001557FF5F|nr:site-specific integrase [Diaphorobacter sp. JS3050]QJY33659.1 tyrosine-type recombinase/integrase [Diaphorobacter sp. JS3050]